MAGDVQRAATLETRRAFLVAEVDGDGDLDQLVLVHAIEVKVHRAVADGIELHVLGDHRLALFAITQGDQVAEQLAGVERLAEGVGVHRHRHRTARTAVQHARHLALAPRGAGAAAADPLAHFHVQDDLGHGHGLPK